MTAAPYPRVDDRAPCRRGDPDRFFPSGPVLPQVLAECAACPFRQPCLEYAVGHNVVGVWGGTTAPQRKRIRRRLGIVPVPVQFGLTRTPEPLSEQRRRWRDNYHRRKAAGE